MNQNMNGNSIIVYRNYSEQQADEFWWSEGWITATKSGDAILVGIIVLLLVFAYVNIYTKLQSMMRQKEKARRLR